MKETLFFAGSGGQGVLSAGKMFSEAIMNEGKEITFFPAYGSAMRGGTSNATVCVSDKPIACPAVIPGKVSIGIYFNYQSMDAFEGYVMPGGTLLYNSSLIPNGANRDDIKVYAVPANALAEKIGNSKCVNMIMLGALIAITGICNYETIVNILSEVFTGNKAELADINSKAIKEGMNYIQYNG